MLDIRDFLVRNDPVTRKKDDEEDEVSPYAGRNALTTRREQTKVAYELSTRQVSSTAVSELQLLQDTLANLKREEAFWQQQIKQASPEVDIDEVVQRLLAASEAHLGSPMPEDFEENEYSVRPILDDDDTILNMFHALTLSSPISVRRSVDAHVYAFDGTALAQKDQQNVKLLKFKCEIVVNTIDYSVDTFNISVESPFTASKELDSFLRICEREKDVSKGLYGLSSYSELSIKRWTVFDKIASKYEIWKDGTWPMGHTIAFPRTEIQLFISWEISLDVHILAEASSDIQAFVRPTTTFLDKTQTFSKINTIFSSLIQEHGVFHAICTIHDILYN